MRKAGFLLALLLIAAPLYAQQVARGSIGASGGVVVVRPPDTKGALLIQVTGTWSATLTFEGSVDGTTFVDVPATNVTTSSAGTTTTANGVFSISGSGWQFVRLRATAYSSGTAVVTISAGPGGGTSGASGSFEGTLEVGAQPATDPHFVRCSDGSSAAPCVVTATNLDVQSGGEDILSTTAFNAAFGTAGNSDTQVLSVQGIASGTALPVSLASVPSHAVTQSGTWTVQPGNTANTTAWLFAGGLTANGAAAAGNRLGVLPCIAETGALPTLTDGRDAPCYVDTNGVLYSRTVDPCSLAKTTIPINISSATTTELTSALAGASTHYYVCSLNLVTAGANNVALVDDDTDNCASVTSGLAGGTTAGSGWNFGANGGIAFGNGTGTVFKTNGANRVLCLVTSAAVQLSGSITVVAAP